MLKHLGAPYFVNFINTFASFWDYTKQKDSVTLILSSPLVVETSVTVNNQWRIETREGGGRGVIQSLR